MEIWKDIKDYEGLYQVSNYGNVRSLIKRTGSIIILKPDKTQSGYFRVTLCKNYERKRYMVHRLVAEAFIPNPNNLPQVNHKDENKTNNRLDNLEWCTPKYNINYGTCIKRFSEKMINNKKISKIVIQFTKCGEFINEYPSVSECGRNGFNIGAVAACCRGILKSHKGYIWKYKEK